MPARLFSDAEIVWLRMTYPIQTADETLWLFNETWDRSITKAQLKNAASRFRLGKSKDWEKARFQKGQVPPNKGRKGYHPPGSEKGWFAKGHVPDNLKPLWSERWCHIGKGDKKTPVLEMKVPGPAPWVSHRKRSMNQKTHWIRKAVWVWEQINGPVPPGHVIAQLDGDPANCEPENLECVPRGVMARRNAYHAPTPAAGDKDAYKATIRIAQIKEAIANR